jgi:hypothetical protein
LYAAAGKLPGSEEQDKVGTLAVGFTISKRIATSFLVCQTVFTGTPLQFVQAYIVRFSMEVQQCMLVQIAMVISSSFHFAVASVNTGI